MSVAYREKSFTFMDSTINLYIQDYSEHIYMKLSELFKTHFTIENKAKDQYVANLYLRHIIEFDRSTELCKEFLSAENVIIRTSSVDKFRLAANKYINDKTIIYDCTYSDTIIIMEADSKNITIYCSEMSDIQLIEFIRDLIIKDQELKGTLILHSAAAEKNGKGFIISGSKGAGKTTTLMEFLYKKKCKMVSGDKVFLKVSDGEITLYGWPDYTHIGVGTLRRFPQLIKMIEDYGISDIDNRRSNDKILIEPSFFNKHAGITYCKEGVPLEYILFPKYTDVDNMLLKKISNITEYIIPNLEFKEDFKQAKWHEFIAYKNPHRQKCTNELIEALDKYNAYSVKGNLMFENLFDEGIL